MDTTAYQGETVLVTGAASGIGTAIVRAVCAAGADTVWLADVDTERLRTTAAEIETTSDQTLRVQTCDISDRSSVVALFDEISRHGSLDSAFLNAGINRGVGIASPGGGIDEFDFAMWRQVLEVNLDGFFHTMQHTAALMKAQRKGSIVVTASTAGLRAEPLIGYAYVASKHAVVGVTKQAALELAPYGIRVNAVAPGPINTRIGGDGVRPDRKTTAFEQSVPLRRWGEAVEVAALASFLGSRAAGFNTGGIHTVDGGAVTLTQVLADDLHRADAEPKGGR